jgi:hypothetical protein
VSHWIAENGIIAMVTLLDEFETTDDAALVTDEDQASVIDGLVFFVWIEFGPVRDTRPPEPAKPTTGESTNAR